MKENEDWLTTSVFGVQFEMKRRGKVEGVRLRFSILSCLTSICRFGGLSVPSIETVKHQKTESMMRPKDADEGLSFCVAIS